MNAAFNPRRRVPTLVGIANLRANFGSDRQLVEVGGSGLRELREDVFDNAFNSAASASSAILNCYDIALCGGEPYQTWH